MNNLIFLIESGRALQLVQQHLAEWMRVRQDIRVICEELGVTQIVTDRINGKLSGVVFKSAVHPDWKKPNRRGVSFPKRGTPWAKRLQAQQGYQSAETTIAHAFGVPLSIDYDTEAGWGSRHIGNFLNACGFGWISDQGPFALWTPNVPAEVAFNEARGDTVREPAKSWRPVIDGARLIEPEEWDILVAQHKLASRIAEQKATQDASVDEAVPA